ncbi:MAG TPA: hypothetical protein VGR45_17400 [Stellaceae bacterium]|nr:hypothetical protein [Stellaceae bacterium]
MRSSLRARFGHRVRVEDSSRVASGSPARYLLRADPTFARTVTAARALTRRHLSLREAKGAVERLLEGEDVAVELPAIEDAAAFETELAGLGVVAVRREIAAGDAPQSARHPARVP